MSTPTFPNAVWDGTTANSWRGHSHFVDPQQDDWNRIVAELIAIQNWLLNGIGAFDIGTPHGDGVSLVGTRGEIQVLTFRLDNVSVPTVDTPGVGAIGSLKILDVPQGLLQFMGARVDFTFAKQGSGLTDNALVLAGLGTIAATNPGLDGDAGNLVNGISTALIGGQGTFLGVSVGTALLDGTSTPVDLFLNFGVEDGSSMANDSITVNGTLVLSFINLRNAL
jgi:hypothetical protein